MNRNRSLLSLLVVLFLLAASACSSDPESTSDTSSTDVLADVSEDGVLSDVVAEVIEDGVTDVTEADANEVSQDVVVDAEVTSTVPLEGFGTLSGTCGVLDDELTSTESFFFSNAIDFGLDPYDTADFALLSAGGQEIINDGNAGGNSVMSEVFAYEVLHRCELAELLKTETEVIYATTGTITDLLLDIDGLKVGVSVTRAVGWPREDPYTATQAQSLLEDKLNGVLASSANVSSEDRWVKQILHVIAYAPEHVTSLQTAYDLIDPSIKADTIVLVTVSNGEDIFLYN